MKFIISQNEQAAISSILRNYVQQNEYDEAGNIMKTIHQATGGKGHAFTIAAALIISL